MPNVALEDVDDLLAIFKVTENKGRIGFYWQLLNAGKAELDPPEANNNYTVEVGFGSLFYAGLSLWPAIRIPYSYVIPAKNLGNIWKTLHYYLKNGQ